MRAGVSKINPNPFTTRPEIDGTFGVVASTHWIATAVGMATLEKESPSRCTRCGALLLGYRVAA